jgi:hypothetical protein
MIPIPPSKVRGTWGEVARPDEALGAEHQLLPPTAQRHARLVAEREHDVREPVEEVELIDERRRKYGVTWRSAISRTRDRR